MQCYFGLFVELQLDDTFSSWCRLLYLHVWSVHSVWLFEYSH